MSVNTTPQTVTAAQFDAIFEKERVQAYPMVDAFETRMGFAIDRGRLESVARILSCPWKAAPPNWQHGRVLYAMTREYLARTKVRKVVALDIGTAKGFSALMVREACLDAGVRQKAWSVDVLPPDARVRRNTVAEVDRLQTLRETLVPFPESRPIQFVQSTGIDWLKAHTERIHVAFVDGKHDGAVVFQEGQLLAERQQPGDVVMFDDVHIPALAQAVKTLDAYTCERLQVLPGRAYAIGVRR
jgi:predicted O-methyltransferase YrrM